MPRLLCQELLCLRDQPSGAFVLDFVLRDKRGLLGFDDAGARLGASSRGSTGGCQTGRGSRVLGMLQGRSCRKLRARKKYMWGVINSLPCRYGLGLFHCALSHCVVEASSVKPGKDTGCQCRRLNVGGGLRLLWIIFGRAFQISRCLAWLLHPTPHAC